MGKALRAERLPSTLKNKVMEIRREACGRAPMRGLLLLALLFGSLIFVSGQTPAELTLDNAARLRRMIESGSVEEKRTALFDIRNLRSPEASSIAVPALRDSDEMVRATAASSVIFMTKADAAGALVPLLADRAEFVRREAAHALGEVGDRSATGALVRLMEKEKVLEVRTSAASSLGKIGDPAAIEGLLKILRSKPVEDEEFLRRNAARSIGQIGQITLTGERSVLTPENFLPDRFKELGPAGAGNPNGYAAATDVLMRVLGNNSEADDTRREAAFALGWMGDARAVAPLQKSLSSTDPYLVEIAREALMRIERRNKFSASKN